MKSKWPKKMKVSEYIALHYAGNTKSRTSIISEIKNGSLPGIKDGGIWVVYVLPDGAPAYGYSEERPAMPAAPKEDAIKLTGNAMADKILAKTAANCGMRVA